MIEALLLLILLAIIFPNLIRFLVTVGLIFVVITLFLAANA